MNMPVRQYLMNNSKLISAIRLPNNMFSDHAGTDVGSDLIILQKEQPVRILSNEEKDFISTHKNSSGIILNSFIENSESIVFTDIKNGKDPYGKPAMEYYHSGGIDAIARLEELRVGEEW